MAHSEKSLTWSGPGPRGCAFDPGFTDFEREDLPTTAYLTPGVEDVPIPTNTFGKAWRVYPGAMLVGEITAVCCRHLDDSQQPLGGTSPDLAARICSARWPPTEDSTPNPRAQQTGFPIVNPWMLFRTTTVPIGVLILYSFLCNIRRDDRQSFEITRRCIAFLPSF